MYKRPAFIATILCALFLTSPTGQISARSIVDAGSANYFNEMPGTVIEAETEEEAKETTRRGRDPNLVLVACIPSPVETGICLARAEPVLSKPVRVLGACIASPNFDIGHCGIGEAQLAAIVMPPVVGADDPTRIVPTPSVFALSYPTTPVKPTAPGIRVSSPTPGYTPLPVDPGKPGVVPPFVPSIETGGNPNPPSVGRPETPPEVAPVPLPAPGLMLLGGLGCLALKRRRKA